MRALAEAIASFDHDKVATILRAKKNASNQFIHVIDPQSGETLVYTPLQWVLNEYAKIYLAAQANPTSKESQQCLASTRIIIQLLLEHGANIVAYGQPSTALSPLFQAILLIEHDKWPAETLISAIGAQGIDINQHDCLKPPKNIPLPYTHAVICYSRPEKIQDYLYILKLLVRAGGKIPANLPGNHHTPVLCVALDVGVPDLAKYLLEDYKIYGDQYQASLSACLFLLANHNKAVALKLLLELGADVFSRDPNNLSAFYYAAVKGHEGILRALITQAIYQGKTAKLTELLGETEAGNLRCTEAALSYGHLACYKILSTFDKKPINANYVLFLACYNQAIQSVKIALQLGANINSTYPMTMEFESGISVTPLMTPLSVACINRSLPMVEFLMQQGASPNGGGPECVNSLWVAVVKNHIDFLNFFLNQGGNPFLIGGTTNLDPYANPLIAALYLCIPALELFSHHYHKQLPPVCWENELLWNGLAAAVISFLYQNRRLIHLAHCCRLFTNLISIEGQTEQRVLDYLETKIALRDKHKLKGLLAANKELFLKPLPFYILGKLINPDDFIFYPLLFDLNARTIRYFLTTKELTIDELKNFVAQYSSQEYAIQPGLTLKLDLISTFIKENEQTQVNEQTTPVSIVSDNEEITPIQTEEVAIQKALKRRQISSNHPPETSALRRFFILAETHTPAVFSWFNGILTSTQSRVITVAGATNLFFYFPNALKGVAESDIERFRKKASQERIVLATGNNDEGLKPIKSDKQVTLFINGEKYTAQINYEFKICPKKGKPKRLICCSLNGLIIPCYYFDEGLHKNAAKKQLTKMADEIYLDIPSLAATATSTSAPGASTAAAAASTTSARNTF